jgi:hypothetical protein
VTGATTASSCAGTSGHSPPPSPGQADRALHRDERHPGDRAADRGRLASWASAWAWGR